MVTRLMTGRRLSTSSEEMGGLLRLSNVYSLRRSCGTNLRFFTNSRKMAQFPQMLQSTNQNQVFRIQNFYLSLHRDESELLFVLLNRMLYIQMLFLACN